MTRALMPKHSEQRLLDDTHVDDGYAEGRANGKPEKPPTATEIAEVEWQEARHKEFRLHGSQRQDLSSDDYLKDIEPDAKAYYDRTHDAELAMQLSQAISQMRTSKPKPVDGTPVAVEPAPAATTFTET